MKKVLVLLILFIISITGVYAKEYYGDVDNNEKISVNDDILIKKHILGMRTLSDDEVKRADMNTDNKISISDYIAIKRIILYKTEPKELPPDFEYLEIPTKDLCLLKTYNGKDQAIVSKSTLNGYVLSNVIGKDAGDYTVTAIIGKGYKWADNTTSNKTFKCTIDKAYPIITISDNSGTVKYSETISYSIKTNTNGVFENKSSSDKNIQISPTKQDAQADTSYKI